MADSPHRIAAEALGLRAWAARVLLTEDAPTPPPASAAAWAFFAEMEWCSLPLLERLGALPQLRGAAELEERRIGAALSEIGRLAGLAAREGWKVVLLKGGAAVANGGRVHLADVDVLAEPAQAAALAAALDPERRQGPWNQGEYKVHPDGPGGLLVEVHDRLDELGATAPLLARAVPCPAAPGLWRLGPRDQLRHLLVHSVLKHPDRIARLRDVLLVRDALAACDAEEIAGVMEEAKGSEALLVVLEMARGATHTRAERYVRRRYLLLSRWKSFGGGSAWWVILSCATEMTAAPRTPIIEQLTRPPEKPSPIPLVRALYRRAPALDRLVRRAVRAALLAAAASLATLAFAEERLRRTR